jgi:hypothetical protein
MEFLFWLKQVYFRICCCHRTTVKLGSSIFWSFPTCMLAIVKPLHWRNVPRSNCSQNRINEILVFSIFPFKIEAYLLVSLSTHQHVLAVYNNAFQVLNILLQTRRGVFAMISRSGRLTHVRSKLWKVWLLSCPQRLQRSFSFSGSHFMHASFLKLMEIEHFKTR